MQLASPDYSKLLTKLRAMRLLVLEYASTQPHVSALDTLEQNLAESIAQLETLSSLSNAIAEIGSAETPAPSAGVADAEKLMTETE